MRFFHWLAHLFLLNNGKVYSWYDGDVLMIGFKCSGCDTISGVYIAGTWVNNELRKELLKRGCGK